MKPGKELTAPTPYDSFDEALMETFPANDPIAVSVMRPVQLESADPAGNERPNSDPDLTVVEEWHDLLLRSRASISLAPRRRPPDRLAS
jgi:hypothetical protein